MQNLELLKNYTILYAEDEKGIQEETNEILELLFKKVFLASNGLEAKELYKKHKPDLVISDIKMPKLNGLDFVKELRKDDEITPIAITTAFTDTELILLAIELNLLKYIIKPVTKEKLFEVFDKFIEKKRKSNIINLNKDYIFYKENSLIKCENEVFNLTLKEQKFLEFLINKKSIVTYDELEYLLEIDNYYNENAIRQFIKKLRKKLPKDYLKNIQNQGYTINQEYL